MHVAELSVYFVRAMDARTPDEVFHDDEKYRQLLAEINAKLTNPFGGRLRDSIADAESIAVNDLIQLKASDVVLADLSVEGYQYVGGLFEIVHATLENLPVILVVGNSDLHTRAFFQAHCEFITQNPSDAVQYIGRAHTDQGLQAQMAEMMAYYEAAALDYDRMSAGADNQAITDSEGFSRERNELRRVLDRYVRGRACEVGVGTGDWTETICEKATDVVGIDAGKTMLDQARTRLRRFSNLQLVQCNVLSESLRSGNYDCVILYFFLSLLPRRLQDELFERLLSLVKPSGLLIVADTKKVLAQPSIGLGNRRLQTRMLNGQTFTLYKEHFVGDALSTLLQSKGYEIVESSQESIWFTWAVSRRPH